MPARLLVTVSSLFDRTRPATAALVGALDDREVPVSLLVAPHIDGHWHLAHDPDTCDWLLAQQAAGRTLILNGFDKPAQGRRAEFATLDEHEARLRIKGATRHMASIGFDLDIFAPPRWHMSAGTMSVLPEFPFTLAASTKGLHNLRTGTFVSCRNLSVGEGYGTATWWRRNIIRAAARGAAKGNTVRLSISARKLADEHTAADFLAAVDAAVAGGAVPADYRAYA